MPRGSQEPARPLAGRGAAWTTAGGIRLPESPLSPPAPGSEVGDSPDRGLPAGHLYIGAHSWDVWGLEWGYAGPGVVMEVQDTHLEGEGQGACLQPRISERPLLFWAPGAHPGSLGSDCKETAFDPFGTEVALLRALF